MTQQVIAVLNDARGRELQAISQYMAQHYELDNQGVIKLAAMIKEIAKTEMKHAESLADRILFLDGQVNYKPAGLAKTGQDIAAMLQTNIALETEAIRVYSEAAATCAAEKDQISRALFEKLIGDEEEHLDEFQKTLEHITKLGDAYVATLMG